MAANDTPRYCDVKPRIIEPLPPGLPDTRQRLIQLLRTKWVNGTELHYWFASGPAAQKQAVRDAFAEWKALPIGLVFTEVSSAAAAEVRIAFDQADGSWSYVGRDVLGIPTTEMTMNFGWDLTDDYGRTTALHEIGHTLGMPHEHQNPFAGILWNEEAVYASLGAPPNNWSRDQVFNNVLKKISPSEVVGSTWDPNSVMEYWFGPGLIVQPAQYAAGLRPAGGLSDLDKQYMKQFYPGDAPTGPKVPLLGEFASAKLKLAPGEQADFRIEPAASRQYRISTFGATDTVMVLFEDVAGELRYLAGDDDSGDTRNAMLDYKLLEGRKYLVRVRLYWAGASGKSGLMYW
ncbi:M12 family metallopeptidase [Paeniglutamicibacter cryotolerans]|uniref:Peptidase metallopeptidase domain-containing protein n=1 Tax=Paeniglutamicibacter cryotolerans TaxID=670079 RepID=A0A839QN80_9MICC|nr:M12 family metallopeptidase [Paeniglutamicibacter cryotolerans]MBB2997053.1 hypothetical protein [Paeniglutamicibacter cryotolerans]